MHLVLTDILVCPKCGSGLIVLAEAMAGRQIVRGSLGCPGCHTNYPVEEGVADLRLAQTSREPVDPYEGDPVRLLALTGQTEPRGFLLLLGAVTGRADELSAALPGQQLVTINASEPRSSDDVSALLAGDALPFEAGSLRGVILTGALPAGVLEQCARVLGSGARLVIESSELTSAAVEASGLRVLARAGDTCVAARAT